MSIQYLHQHSAVMKLVLIFGFVAAISAITFPNLQYDVANQAYNYRRQERGLEKQDLPDSFLLRKSTLEKRDDLTLNQRINIAFLICGGRGEQKYFYNDIMRHWPQTWLENAKNMLFHLVFYADFDGDGQFTDPILTQDGEFNVTLDCNQERGCVYVNPRRTINTILGLNVSYVTEDTAVFVFQRSGDISMLCGFDSALEGTGINGLGDVKYPIFRNVLNPDGMQTADVFTTATNDFDAGVGSNAYSYGIKPGPNGTATNELTIFSKFDIYNPTDPLKKIFLSAQQTTSYSLPIPPPPV